MKHIKILIAILLVLGVFNMPYGFYQFLRIAVCIFGIIQFILLFKEKSNWIALYFVLMVLFNPVWPIYLDKSLWKFIDLAAGGLVLGHFFAEIKNSGTAHRQGPF